MPMYQVDHDHGHTLITSSSQSRGNRAGVLLPNQIEVSSIPSDHLDCYLRITVRPVAGQFQAVDLFVAQIPDGVPVTRSVIASLPVTEWIEGCAGYVGLMDDDGEVSFPAKFDVKEYAQTVMYHIQHNRPDDGDIEEIADLYKVLYAANLNPGQTIHELTGVNRATVTRWLSRAERLGYLDPDERGRTKRGGAGSRSKDALLTLIDGQKRLSRIDLPFTIDDPVEDLQIWATDLKKAREAPQDHIEIGPSKRRGD